MQTTLPTPVIAVIIAQFLIICYVFANLKHFPRAIPPLYYLFAILCVGIGAWDHFQRQGAPRQAKPDRLLSLCGILVMCIPTYHLLRNSPGLQGLPERIRYAATASCVCAVVVAIAFLAIFCVVDVSHHDHQGYTPVAKDIEAPDHK